MGKGLTALSVQGWVSLLLATGNCKSLSSALLQLELGWFWGGICLGSPWSCSRCHLQGLLTRKVSFPSSFSASEKIKSTYA